MYDKLTAYIQNVEEVINKCSSKYSEILYDENLVALEGREDIDVTKENMACWITRGRSRLSNANFLEIQPTSETLY